MASTTLLIAAATTTIAVRCGKKDVAVQRGRRKKQGKEAAGKGGGIAITTGTKRSHNGFGMGGKLGEKLAWQCATGCGACCKLDKGPAFPTPEEIFIQEEHISLLHLYKSMIGEDGWCIHYDHSNRICSIYHDRPVFCRVEPQVFEDLFAVDKRNFNKEACRSCRDTIKSVYGSESQELKNFNRCLSRGRDDCN